VSSASTTRPRGLIAPAKASGVPRAYLAAASLALAVVFRKFFSFDAVYLYTDEANDSVNSFYPRMLHLFQYWSREGLPGWSFQLGLGQNAYPFSWNDPFYLLLLPFKDFAYGLAYMEAAKILSAGALFCLYLRRLSLSNTACAAGGFLFAFSAYPVLGSAWTSFSTEAVVCAGLLLALEGFLQAGAWLPVTAVFALLSFWQPFFLLAFSLLAGAYALSRGARGKAFLALAGASALGIAAGGVFLLPDLREMLGSPRVSSVGGSRFGTFADQSIFGVNTPKHYATQILRLFSSDLLRTPFGFQGAINYLEAPLFYCGLGTLLLAPQAFARLAPRDKKKQALWLAAVMVPLVFPFFRHAFWAFSGNYYRTFAFFLTVPLIVLAARAVDAFEAGKAPSRPLLAGSLAVALVLLYGAPVAAKVAVDGNQLPLVAAILVAHAGLLYLIGDRAAARPARLALLALIGIEAVAFANVTVNARDFIPAEAWETRQCYRDKTLEAVAWLKERDKSFFRVEKTYRSSPDLRTGFNDALAQGFYGTSEYWSMTQPSYAAFSAELGLLEPGDKTARYLHGLGAREKLMDLAGVKYMLSRRPLKGLKKLASFDDVAVYQRPGARPLGWTYNRSMTLEEFRSLPEDEKDRALLDFAVSGPEGLSGKRRSPLEVTEFSQNKIKGRVALDGRQLLFLSIPFDAGWSARVDGRDAELRRAGVGFTGLALEEGEHDVELEFVPPLREMGALLSFAALLLTAVLRVRFPRVRA
jgi:hypothetical protein